MVLSVLETLPNKKIFTKEEIQQFLDLSDRQVSDKVYYLKRRGLIEAVRNGVYVNNLIEKFSESEKVQLATTLYPDGYVTGYEALRYWSAMSDDYEGVCLRVDWTIYVAVKQVVSRPVEWQGYSFKPFQMSEKLTFGIVKTKYGLVAEPEKAVLDLLYMRRDPDNIEGDMLNRLKLERYALRFPPRIKNLICH